MLADDYNLLALGVLSMQQDHANALSELKFPVLCFVRGDVSPVETLDELTSGTAHALRKGYYSDQEVVDSEGTAIKIKGARKLNGIGPFRGYSIFLGQRIRLELLVEPNAQRFSFDEIKRRVLENLRAPHSWESMVGFDEFEQELKKASSTCGILTIMLKWNRGEQAS